MRRRFVQASCNTTASYVCNDSVVEAYWNMRKLMDSGKLCRDAHKAAYSFCLAVKRNANIQDPSWPVGTSQAPTLGEVED